MALRRDSNWTIPNLKNSSKFGQFLGLNRSMRGPLGLADQMNTYIPFDMTFAKPSLPTVMPPPLEMSKARLADDTVIENALNTRLKELSATEDEKIKLDSLVNMVQSMLEDLKNYAGEDADSRK